MNLTKELETAKKAAIVAGQVILEIYNREFEIEYKDDESPLTEADKKANDIIIKFLKEFKEYAILSEEEKDNKDRLNNDWCWIVDPLDGTKEFIKKNGEFTVNIALAYKHKVVLGVIYVPVKNELYYASKGTGAFLIKNCEIEPNHGDGSFITMSEANAPREDKGTVLVVKRVENIKKLQVTSKLNNLALVGSKSHASEQLKKLIEVKQNIITSTVSAGSSLKGCMIASGDADIYYRFGYTCEWDTAAMQCIVEESGAIFKQMDKTEMTYNRENNLNEKGFFIVNREENIFV